MISVLAATASVIATAHALPNPNDPDHPARANLVAEQTALVPGQTARIGVLFDIDREWHLYWKGLNDSGFAPEIELTLPAGFSAGEVKWPAPKRKISPGEILDHIYERRILLMIPIEVPEDATPGQRVHLSANVEWLVCKEACIPGWGDYSLSLPVAEAGNEPTPSRYASLFAEMSKRLPRPLPEENAPLSMTREGNTWNIAAPDARRIAYYPAEDSGQIENLLKEGDREEQTLELHLGRPDENDRLVGIVEIWSDPATSTVWWIDTDPQPEPETASTPVVSE